MQICKADKCIGCGVCENVCSIKCISMKMDEEGFRYPVINEDRCLKCNKCVRACPVENGLEIKNKTELKVYAAWNKDEIIRERSSSGGIFYLLAKTVIDQQGVAAGAGFDEEKHVRHYLVDSEEQLGLIMGSKYVQSDCSGIFKQIEEVLRDGRWVLFSGTACQAAGLRSYLGKEYDKLLCVDVVCHGAPSTKVWDRYITALAGEKDRIGSIEFRNKRTGWKNYSLVIRDRNREKIYEEIWHKSTYMQGFVNDLYLRKSCYQCEFKGDHLQGDITLGDLWGAEQICPDEDDDKGISLVLIRTEKGRQLFRRIAGQVKTKEIGFSEAVTYNPSVIHSTGSIQDREEFFDRWNTQTFTETVKELLERK